MLCGSCIRCTIVHSSIVWVSSFVAFWLISKIIVIAGNTSFFLHKWAHTHLVLKLESVPERPYIHGNQLTYHNGIRWLRIWKLIKDKMSSVHTHWMQCIQMKQRKNEYMKKIWKKESREQQNSHTQTISHAMPWHHKYLAVYIF